MATSERSRPVRAVLFDLDGTLVDTNFLHAVTWWQALRQHGHVVPMAPIHRAVGLGADKILDHLVPDRDTSQDDDVVAAHDTLMAEWHQRVRPLPGAAELLRWCADSGLAVVLATSASDEDLEALRRVIDADEAITAVTTSSDAEQSKPDVDILEVALERVGAGPTEAVFVGDAVWDMMAATTLGMPCIGVESGGTSAAELLEAGAGEVWQDTADLLAHVADSLLLPHR